MRTAILSTLLLAAALPVAAMAQSAAPQSVQETARQAAPATTGAGADLQGYALLLQQAESALAQARQVHASGRTESQTGAFSQERIDLMQTVRNAWRDMQKVPPGLADSDVYRQAERAMRENFGSIGPDRSLSKEKADAAAQDALRVLSDLRGHVVSAAGQAGAPMHAPAVEGGGANQQGGSR